MTYTTMVLTQRLDRAQHARQRLEAALIHNPASYAELHDDLDRVNKYIGDLLLMSAAVARRETEYNAGHT
jgi:hypothetical protein